jgi:hypothetical protein
VFTILDRKSASTVTLPPALLLEVFAEPIMFHRCYVALTGSVTAALSCRTPRMRQKRSRTTTPARDGL